MDEASVAEIEADVTRPVEEEQVAGLQARAPNRAADLHLPERRPGQMDAETAVDKVDEAGAVEASRGRCAAPRVRDADEMAGDDDRALSERSRSPDVASTARQMEVPNMGPRVVEVAPWDVDSALDRKSVV